MKNAHRIVSLGILALGVAAAGCGKSQPAAQPANPPLPANEVAATPPLSPDNIISIASASKDHTTLVSLVKAADYVTPVSASGPLTVFAPTNEAFAKLPEGTLETLMKPENQAALQEILKYHVTTSGLTIDSFKDGQVIAMANGKKCTMGVKDGEVTINGAKIIATIPAENGVIHVIDAVLTAPAG